MNSAKKLRKTTKWERLEFPSRKLAISREHSPRMGMIKGRNDKDITEAGKLKKNSKNTRKNYTKNFYPNDRDNHDGVVTQL